MAVSARGLTSVERCVDDRLEAKPNASELHRLARERNHYVRVRLALRPRLYSSFTNASLATQCTRDFIRVIFICRVQRPAIYPLKHIETRIHTDNETRVIIQHSKYDRTQ